jgi:enoyl-CoA hydratase/carnithine racemase
MTSPLFVQEIDKRGVARITLTRAEVHNAFNEAVIADLPPLIYYRGRYGLLPP